MAKMSKSATFTKAIIDKENMTITEVTKDGDKVYSLDEILTQWNGVSGISLAIKTDNEIASIEE